VTTPGGLAGPVGSGDAATSVSPDDPAQLAAEIERTRERLGETVEALAAKADVKARAQQKASQLTVQLKNRAGQASQQISKQIRERPVPVAVAAAGVGAVVLTLLLIGRSRHR
jgi:Protein of unknown function (DUF3618)